MKKIKMCHVAVFVARAARKRSEREDSVITVMRTDMSGWIYRTNIRVVSGWIEGFCYRGVYYPCHLWVKRYTIPTPQQLRHNYKPMEIGNA